MQTPDLTIGDVARRSGVAQSTIRFYEESGLLPRPARQGGQRRYGEGVLNRLAVIEYAKSSGFTLEEIRRLFHAGDPISARWKELATAKIQELELQKQRISLMNELLRKALKCRCVDVEECGRRIRASK